MQHMTYGGKVLSEVQQLVHLLCRLGVVDLDTQYKVFDTVKF